MSHTQPHTVTPLTTTSASCNYTVHSQPYQPHTAKPATHNHTRRQVAQTKEDAARDNVHVPTTVSEYCVTTSVQSASPGAVVWCGVVWCGVVWCGVVWCGVVCVVWCSVVWCSVALRCGSMAHHNKSTNSKTTKTSTIKQ